MIDFNLIILSFVINKSYLSVKCLQVLLCHPHELREVGFCTRVHPATGAAAADGLDALLIVAWQVHGKCSLWMRYIMSNDCH